MAWDQSGYYQDQSYAYDPNYEGYANYGYDPNYGYYDYQQEDTESAKLRRDQEEKERLEALESNRLYLKKVKKRCVKEEFADLEKLQLFLFEVMIERMEVNSDSDLGLVPDDNQTATIAARVKFLNSPYMELCEKGVEGSFNETTEESQYFQVVGEAGQEQATNKMRTTWEKPKEEGEEGEENKEPMFNTKWENANGKSCLFSETPIMILHDLDRYPVILQVVRSVVPDHESDDSETFEPIGYAQCRVPEEFSLSVIQSCKEDVILPVSISHRETLELRNVFGVKKGIVDLFIRLSSFGPAIITSFQSSGPDRKYTFKPSPMSSNFQSQKEHEDFPRSDLLKPIIAEEEGTYGITVQKEHDIFQKPVLWKKPDLAYLCRESSGSLDSDNISTHSSLGSLRRSEGSNFSLCRNVLPPSVFRKLKFDKNICDWHSLVSSEVRNDLNNSPGCQCLANKKQDKNRQETRGPSYRNSNRTDFKVNLDPDTNQQERDGPSYKNSNRTDFKGHLGPDKNRQERDGPSNRNSNRTDVKGHLDPRSVTRVHKLLGPIKDEPNVKGLGIPQERTGCGCDCPFIKDVLKNKKLFLI